MGRLIAVFTACTLLIPAAPVAAAELTRVVSSGEANHAFGLDLSVRWERSQRRATITRESVTAAGAGEPFGAPSELPQLRYTEITNLLAARLAVGLWEDLQLHAELPYYLSQETSWRLASGVGPGLDYPDTITNNTVQVDGAPCVGTCPIFPVSGTQTVFHGGVTGDLKIGLSWAPFAEKRDDTKPTWVLAFEATVPTAKLYDPAAGRNTFWDSPYTLSSNAAPVGQKVWRYDLSTAMSRRMGALDPYFKAHVTFLQKSSATYSNCDHAAELAAAGQLNPDPAIVAACAGDPARYGARLPWLFGVTFGTELVPFEDVASREKFAFDLRLVADYTSAARWYNELTDATGKLLATQSYVSLLGRLGLVFRASEYVSLQASGALGWVSPHFLSGENFDTRGDNPNFDWRYDAPGRRFRSTEGSVFDLQVSGALQF